MLDFIVVLGGIQHKWCSFNVKQLLEAKFIDRKMAYVLRK